VQAKPAEETKYSLHQFEIEPGILVVSGSSGSLRLRSRKRTSRRGIQKSQDLLATDALIDAATSTKDEVQSEPNLTIVQKMKVATF